MILGLNVYEFPREENLKQQWLIKIKCRNIQSIQQAKMNHAYCVGLNSGWKKMRFQLALKKTFCPNPQPLTHRRLKQRQRTKIKTMLSAFLPPPSPHLFSAQNSQYQNWKANKYSVLTVNELGPWSHQLGSQTFMLPLVLNTNLIKRKSKNDYP